MCLDDTARKVTALPGLPSREKSDLQKLRKDLVATTEYSPFWVIFLVALALGLTAVLGAPPASPETWVLPPEKPALKPGAGEDLVRSNCMLCHSVDYITTQPRLTRGQWQAEVEKMRGKFGAPIATNTIPGLVDYLTGGYGAATR